MSEIVERKKIEVYACKCFNSNFQNMEVHGRLILRARVRGLRFCQPNSSLGSIIYLFVEMTSHGALVADRTGNISRTYLHLTLLADRAASSSLSS